MLVEEYSQNKNKIERTTDLREYLATDTCKYSLKSVVLSILYIKGIA